MDLRYSGPANWGEVNPAQAVGLFRFRRLITQEPASLFPALKLLYGMQPKHQRWLFDGDLLRKQGMVDPEPMPEFDDVGEYIIPDRILTLQMGLKLIDTVRWVGLTEPGHDWIVKSFSPLDFKYGSVPIELKRVMNQMRFYAPSAGLGDATFREFMLADKAFEDRNLTRLAAILYRPGSPGKRNELDVDTMDGRARVLAIAEPALLELIASQFQACKEYLRKCFPHVFLRAEEGAQQSNTGGKRGNWLDVAINMAKLDATKVPQIEQLDLYLAMKVLDEQMRQAEELEAEMQKQRTKK
jgi:hypothetical protein